MTSSQCCAPQGNAISAAETVHDIAEWVQANKHITPRQCTALDNIQDGVAKWSN